MKILIEQNIRKIFKGKASKQTLDSSGTKIEWLESLKAKLFIKK